MRKYVPVDPNRASMDDTWKPAPDEQIKYLGDVQRLELKPGDTIVLTLPCVASDEMLQRVAANMTERFPGHEVIILDKGMKLGVLGS